MEFFRTVIGSFYTPAVYVAARKPNQGLKLMYSFILVIITSIAVMVAGIRYIHTTTMRATDSARAPLDQFVMDFAEQTPVMVLQNGVLSVKAEQPYVMSITFDGKKYPAVVIDTTGKITLHTMDSHAPILVTAREIYVKSKDDTKVYSLEKFSAHGSSPLIVNRALATDTAQRALDWLHANIFTIYLTVGLFVWLGLLLIEYIARIFMLLALGLVGMIASETMRPKIDFGTAVQIAAVAYTPVALLSTLKFCFTANAPNTLILFALGAVMTCVGVFVSREATE